MKKTEIQINVDPYYFGDVHSNVNAESFAFNLVKNIEKFFNINCEYNLNLEGNSYIILEEDPLLQMNIAEFIENNWHSVSPSFANHE
jgi:hypothetical protein